MRVYLCCLTLKNGYFLLVSNFSLIYILLSQFASLSNGRPTAIKSNSSFFILLHKTSPLKSLELLLAYSLLRASGRSEIF